MLKLNDHQIKCLQMIQQARDRGQDKALIVVSNSLQKAEIVAVDVWQYVLSVPKTKVLYISDQDSTAIQSCTIFKIIVGGTKKHYACYDGISFKKNRKTRFLFASFCTILAGLDNFAHNEFEYIVIDELHHILFSVFQSIIQHFTPKFLLGVMATHECDDIEKIRQLFNGKEIYSWPHKRRLPESP